MMIMIREPYRSGSGMQHTPEDSCRGTNKNAAEIPRFDVAHLFTSPHENIPLLREVAIGHRDPETRWKCVCALASLGKNATDALAVILRESMDSVVRARADRALRPVTVVLGALVMTDTAFGVLHREDVKVALLRRHARGDWGELCREDWEANERALFENSRLFSAYHDRAGHKFYIITEHDRSITTVLLPEDY
jgi:hypothetical protein